MSDPDTKRYKSMGKLGSATNIWSLGASLISICNREPHPTTDSYSPENSIPTFNANAQQVYSQNLRNLLSECVRYRGHDRIGAAELLDTINRYTAGAEADPEDEDLAKGMRVGQGDAPPSWQPPVKERYRLLMSYDAGEAERVAEEQQDADEEEARKEKQKKDAVEKAKADKAAKAEEDKAKRAAAAEKRKKKAKK